MKELEELERAVSQSPHNPANFPLVLAVLRKLAEDEGKPKRRKKGEK